MTLWGASTEERRHQLGGAQDDVESPRSIRMTVSKNHYREEIWIGEGKKPDTCRTEKDEERLLVPRGIYLGGSSRFSKEMCHNGVK